MHDELNRPDHAISQVRARKEVSAAQQYAAPAAAPAVVLPLEKPERWLERIAELRSRGKHEEADKALAADSSSLEALGVRATIDWLDDKNAAQWAARSRREVR